MLETAAWISSRESHGEDGPETEFYWDSRPPTGFRECQARVSREGRAGLAVAQAADEVGVDAGAREKCAIDTDIVEPGHGSAVEPQSTRRREIQVGTLQAAAVSGPAAAS